MPGCAKASLRREDSSVVMSFHSRVLGDSDELAQRRSKRRSTACLHMYRRHVTTETGAEVGGNPISRELQGQKTFSLRPLSGCRISVGTKRPLSMRAGCSFEWRGRTCCSAARAARAHASPSPPPPDSPPLPLSARSPRWVRRAVPQLLLAPMSLRTVSMRAGCSFEWRGRTCCSAARAAHLHVLGLARLSVVLVYTVRWKAAC